MPSNKIKLGLISLLIFGITGCSTKLIQSPKSTNNINQNYKVNVKREYTGNFLPDVTTIVYINDEIVLKGMLKTQLAGNIESLYNGKKLDLSCIVTNSFTASSSCTVHLDNQRLGEYYFSGFPLLD